MSSFEFDSAYSAITGERLPGVYLPFVEHDETHDVLIDGIPRRDVTWEGWHVLTGYTNQYGYRGAVMHPGETVEDDTLREWVKESGGDAFAIVEVGPGLDEEDNDDYSNESPIGWAVLYCYALIVSDQVSALARCAYGTPSHLYPGDRG